MAQSYEKAGVNLEAGYEVVRRIKKHVASTSRLGVMGNIGAFGYEGGDAAELEAKIHAVEYPLYIDTIRKLLEDERLAKRT